MKSILQEGSSVLKAIEKAWASAGKPHEFSVKIFQEPTKNFLGMTVEQAKIGIFFQDSKPSGYAPKRRPEPKVKPTPKPRQERASRPVEKKRTAIQDDRSRRPGRSELQRAEPVVERAPKKEAEQKPIMWADDMVALADEWLTKSLSAMGKSDVKYSKQINKYYLRFSFDAPILESEEKERQLFRSFSFLMLQALKRKLRRPLRGFKVVLTREP